MKPTFCTKYLEEIRASAGYGDVLCPTCRDNYTGRRAVLVKTVGDKQVFETFLPTNSVFQVFKHGRLILTG